jgi:hypothetical protein
VGRAVRSRDPGLQPQRTALAWWRSALATFVTGQLALRAGIGVGDASLVAVLISVAMLAPASARICYETDEVVAGPSACLRAALIATGIVAMVLLALLHALLRLLST